MDESTPQPADAFEIAPGVWIAPDALDFIFTRSSGPGGQAVNKLATRAQLRVAVADIAGLDDPARRRLRRLAGQRLTKDDLMIIQAYVHRSQHQNRRECLSRLGELVRRALVKPPNKGLHGLGASPGFALHAPAVGAVSDPARHIQIHGGRLGVGPEADPLNLSAHLVENLFEHRHACRVSKERNVK